MNFGCTAQKPLLHYQTVDLTFSSLTAVWPTTTLTWVSLPFIFSPSASHFTMNFIHHRTLSFDAFILSTRKSCLVSKAKALALCLHLGLGMVLPFAWAAMGMNPVRAALQDEIQVYTDDINDEGEWGLELHVNTTPKGLSIPGYPGEAMNALGTRITPEISLGLSPRWEVGLYLPLVKSANGVSELAGIKWRLKWMAIKSEEAQGWFAGLNTEFSQLKYPYSDSSRSLELRTIAGFKDSRWLLATNPVFGWPVSPGFVHHSPEFRLGVKVARSVNDTSRLGFEYYSGMGQVNAALPRALQDNTLFLAWDFDGKPFGFNVGVGRGLNAATDAWTLKTILELPI
jgi:hypothetical protein